MLSVLCRQTQPDFGSTILYGCARVKRSMCTRVRRFSVAFLPTIVAVFLLELIVGLSAAVAKSEHQGN